MSKDNLTLSLSPTFTLQLLPNPRQLKREEHPAAPESGFYSNYFHRSIGRFLMNQMKVSV